MASVPFWLMKKKPYQQGWGVHTKDESGSGGLPLWDWPHGYPPAGDWRAETFPIPSEHSLGPTIIEDDSIKPNLKPSIPGNFIQSAIEALHGEDKGFTDAAGNPTMYLRDEDSPYLQAQGRANAENFPDMPWSMRNLKGGSSETPTPSGGNVFANLLGRPETDTDFWDSLKDQLAEAGEDYDKADQPFKALADTNVGTAFTRHKPVAAPSMLTTKGTPTGSSYNPYLGDPAKRKPRPR